MSSGSQTDSTISKTRVKVLPFNFVSSSVVVKPMDSDQDLEIEIIDKDSGMSSAGGSKDDTPERRVIIVGSVFLHRLG